MFLTQNHLPGLGGELAAEEGGPGVQPGADHNRGGGGLGYSDFHSPQDYQEGVQSELLSNTR